MNKTNRLITFGCSFTFGTGLPDCKEGSATPSNQGWPAILSKKLNLDLVNVSASGASNFEILHNIINFDFQSSDTVIIMWTYFARDLYFRSLFSKIWPIDRLSPGSTSNSIIDNLLDTKVIVGRKWIENMNEKTFALKTWAHIHHADLYLTSKGIKYIHFPALPDDLLKYSVPYKINNFYANGIVRLDVATDNMHPGIKTNEHTANSIYNILNEQI